MLYFNLKFYKFDILLVNNYSLIIYTSDILQKLILKPDKEKIELITTTMATATTITTTTTTAAMEPVKTDQAYTPIAQTTQEALTQGMTDSNMINVDGEPTAQMIMMEHEPPTEEECRRLIEAEMYIHDAIEYVTSDTRPELPSGFIVEEEMLNNTSGSVNITSAPILQQSPASFEATTHMFRTNEVSDSLFAYKSNYLTDKYLTR